MKHGDISNQSSSNIFAFRVEDFLIKSNKKGFINKCKSLINGNLELQEDTVKAINHIFWRTPHNVDLVISSSSNFDKYEKIFSDAVGYNRVHVISEEKEISSALNTLVFDFYVSSEKTCRGHFSKTSGVMSLQEAFEVIQGYKRGSK